MNKTMFGYIDSYGNTAAAAANSMPKFTSLAVVDLSIIDLAIDDG